MFISINIGCLVYPAQVTCFDNFSWSLGSVEVIKMNVHYEALTKGGKNPIFNVENPTEYIKGFNWLPLHRYLFFQ